MLQHTSWYRKDKTWNLEQKYVCLLATLKERRGGIFYNPKEKKVIVSTHATYLEEDYMNNFKPKSKVVLEELD